MQRMRSTSVRLDARTKSELDRFQAEASLRRGRRVSHAQLLAELLEFVREREAEFHGRAWKPFSKAEQRRFLRMGVRTGVRTRPEEIDEVLYGGEAP